MSSLSHVLTQYNIRHDPMLINQPITFQGINGLEEGKATGLMNDYFIEVENSDGRISFIPKKWIEEIGGQP